MHRARWVFVLGLLGPVPESLAAQSADPRPAPDLEFTGGYAGFVDDATIDHGMLGTAVRFHLSPRVSVGPELQFMMIGRDSDRGLLLTGNVTFDVLSPDRRATPFLVAGGGLFNHRNSLGGRDCSSTEAAFTAGGGSAPG